MVLGVGTTEEASGSYIMHFRWEPVDDDFVRKPNRLSGGERHECTGRRNVSSFIDPEYSKLIRIQTGKNLPGSVTSAAGSTQPQELVCFPLIGPLQSYTVSPKSLCQLSGMPGAIH
jgi:hypothetical protein